MADRRYTIVFYAAVLTAAGATFGVYRTLEATRARSRIVTRPVVVATRDMAEGANVNRLSVTVNQWPAATVPAGAYGSLDSVVGRVTRVPVFNGEAIVPGRLAPVGTAPGLEVKIAPGKRAMAVRINDVVGLSGLIQPNSRVDVLVMLREEGNRAKQVAKLFMENMRVLSVGTQVQRDASGEAIDDATTATLEVTPEEAERLAVAMTQGTIQLVLRGYGDPDSVKTKGARYGDVLGQLEAAPTAAPPKPAPVRRAPRPAPRREPAPPPAPVAEAPRKPDTLTVRVFRGDKVSQEKFERRDTTAVSPTTVPPTTVPPTTVPPTP
jgi:pilus assembly protein CpaB